MSQLTQKLSQFRNKVYQLLGRAQDATFDLMDAVLVNRNIYSFAELSLSPVFRRKWPSLYEAIDDCRPHRHKLMIVSQSKKERSGSLLIRVGFLHK